MTKITYTSADVDLDAFHATFDSALGALRETLGREYTNWIGGTAVAGNGRPLVNVTPIDTRVVLGTFAAARPTDVDRAVEVAHAAQRGWARTPWRERVAVLKRAAALIRERTFDLSALISLEVGKSRLEAMADAAESADLIDYYCRQLEEAEGFVREMARVTPLERNVDVLRPYGVFACIAPFNFPLALSTGMSAAALLAGNAVVYKPSEDAPWTGWRLYEIYRDAGLPSGVFNYLVGRREEIGDYLWQHPGVDGIVFTGSKTVGLRIHHGVSTRWIKPCLMELGGKNACLVMPSADVAAAAEGVMRSAFGLQSQKCSATSRVYVHRAVTGPFMERLLECTEAMSIGDPTERGVSFGPVINERAVARYEQAVGRARRDGSILTGGCRLTDGELAHGWYVAPTVARLPVDSPLFQEEVFVPLLAGAQVPELAAAIARANAVEYGLTAGIFSSDAREIERFFDEVEAGVCYANKRSGATTGAWPGAQAFTGWKASGSTGKGGCGPYYIAQFMREQSRTVVES